MCDSDIEDGDRPVQEIEITPQMIEAGYKALGSVNFDIIDPVSRNECEKTVVHVYQAMVAACLDDPAPRPAPS